MNKRSSISGQLAVVTGAASGIGEAVVNRFADEGARIVLLDKDKEKGAAFTQNLSSRGIDVKFYECNVTQLSLIHI